MKTYYIVKKVGALFPVHITADHSEAAALAQKFNSPEPSGYLVHPTTEQGLKDQREKFLQMLTNVEDAIEDIEKLVPEVKK